MWYLGSVQSPEIYNTEAGKQWEVSTSKSVNTFFTTNATGVKKKREVDEFVARKHHIKAADLVKELQTNLFLDAVQEEYIHFETKM